MEFDKKVPLKCVQIYSFPSLASLPEVYGIQYILFFRGKGLSAPAPLVLHSVHSVWNDCYFHLDSTNTSIFPLHSALRPVCGKNVLCCSTLFFAVLL